jgi:hypothetical protein
MGKLLETALAESAGGAAAGAIADCVLYAVDSAKVRSQSASAAGSKHGVSVLFRGLVPTIALGSVPVFGSFFFIYAPLRDILMENGYSKWLPLASVVCAIPATVIGVPADVIKKHLVLGIDADVRAAVSHVVANHGYKGLFAGWHVNLIRDLPFAGVKIGLYEYFVETYKSVYAIEGNTLPTHAVAGAGVASGVCCAVLTCPLDVVNTRIKADRASSVQIRKVFQEIVRKEGVRALFRGVVLRSAVLGFGSSIFWPIQRTVSEHLNPGEPAFSKRLMEF